jgi:hypothetical protein
MAPAERLLSTLDRVRQVGPGRWVAACPAHADRSPSLSIRELEDGRLLVHDFGGCDTASVLAAAGVPFSALFPERPGARTHHAGSIARTMRLQDVARGLDHELTLALVLLQDVAEGRSVDRRRAKDAAHDIAGFLVELRNAR